MGACEKVCRFLNAFLMIHCLFIILLSATFLHKCGAALLSENWAITAAHCVEGSFPVLDKVTVTCLSAKTLFYFRSLLELITRVIFRNLGTRGETSKNGRPMLSMIAPHFLMTLQCFSVKTLTFQANKNEVGKKLNKHGSNKAQSGPKYSPIY